MSRLRSMRFLKWSSLVLSAFFVTQSHAQVTGGRFAMEYLRLPNSPHISALGGINVANPQLDISFALQNPSLMRPSLHNQLGLNYNSYYAGIKVMNLAYGYHKEKIKTDFIFGVQYLNYGTFQLTDQVGNQYGDFDARDYAISLGAARQYGERWRYGVTLKYTQSRLFDKVARAALMDIGISYHDTANLITIGAVAKNIGFMATKYNNANPSEPLPFDLQIGIYKRFQHMPLRLMATVHHLYEWDVRYNNPADLQTGTLFNADSTTDNKSYFADKLFRHFIFAAELSLGKRMSINVGYNHLRRGELKIKDKPATAGFSFGADLYLNKFQVHYARTFYHVAGAYNEIGINFAMNKLLDIGGSKSNWSADYGTN